MDFFQKSLLIANLGLIILVSLSLFTDNIISIVVTHIH